MSMPTRRKMTKSAVALAKTALEAAERAIPRYAHPCSPHKFTQRQIFAILVLWEFPKLDYRGVIERLA